MLSNGLTATVTIMVSEAPITVPANLVAEYRLDECAFDGTVGDVIDNSINRLNGTSIAATGVKNNLPVIKYVKVHSFNGTTNWV